MLRTKKGTGIHVNSSCDKKIQERVRQNNLIRSLSCKDEKNIRRPYIHKNLRQRTMVNWMTGSPSTACRGTMINRNNRKEDRQFGMSWVTCRAAEAKT